MPDSLILVDFITLIKSYEWKLMEVLIFQFSLASGHLLLLVKICFSANSTETASICIQSGFLK
jgi:hypothetical protein